MARKSNGRAGRCSLSSARSSGTAAKPCCRPDWNDRARVEITAKAPEGLAQSAVPWFCHALTGGRWLLDLLIRVPAGTFALRDLAARLDLKTLDDRDDIEAYGQSPRVHLRTAPNGMDQLRITVHDRKEVATPAFRAFLEKAVTAYLSHVQSLAGDAAAAEPWKTDGKAWHLSQQSIGAGEAKSWKPMTLTALLGLITRPSPTSRCNGIATVFVDLEMSDGRRLGKIITNRGDSLRVDLHVPRGRFTPTQVEHLGARQEFARPRHQRSRADLLVPQPGRTQDRRPQADPSGRRPKLMRKTSVRSASLSIADNRTLPVFLDSGFGAG